ncbi:unnamed protein product [Rotaria sp. Silwood1]|nr:unnamed protein product [Rotaria sp. Silwood1]CAF1618919.1 unnamed protein product [Rotaria sp. Silwood1]CAF4577041.1 unnamed protein product [Rotaria sp. Silwood1]CAF4592381.1 unnamed protein product [Rotaria sp. Silwood1]CAF4593942.1 unnamed protein product [Rotaria sp. Silwood1]
MLGAKYDFSRDRERRAGVDDMVFMSKNTDSDISHNLKIRFDVNYIYTYIGSVLIAVNPYKDVEYCRDNHMEKYRGATQMDNAPHIFAIAEDMFSNMLIDSEKQCVIISGESGAGKTVSAKFIMSYIAEVSGGGPNVQRIKSVILQSNPLLEAFGNAKTIRNDNSSRFGKYVEIIFSRGGEPIGGAISNFLLEKSRVVSQAENERNFHIFYQLLSSREFCQQYSLSHELRFQYINHAESSRVAKIDDTKEMQHTLHAMDVMGFSSESKQSIFSLLADLQAPCAYFGIQIDYLKTKLISKRLEFKEHQKNELIDQTFTVDKAIFTRDALAKSIYSRIFDYLIQAVNSAFQTTAKSDLSMGILDIYGFEIFERNSFEQFCINYVNEKLQQIFIELTLKKEQEEYKRENIQWTPISFFNNIVVCDLFEAKQPPGMFLLLDDICLSSHATTEKVDKSYLHKLSSLSNQYLIVSPPTFTVRHYAGAVIYHSDQFCEKNRDILNIDLIEMMQSSTIPFVVRLFPEQTANIKSRPTTAGTKIRTQANLLVEKLMGCQPHYVRCIKPNENQAPSEWNSSSVIEQVKYLGLVANIEVRKAGFVYRREFAKFLSRYAILTKQTWPKWNGKVTDGVMHIVDTMHLDRREVQLGNTKVFIKSPESLHILEDMRLRKFDNYARIIQRAMKRFCAVRVYQKQREQATDILYGHKERNARSLDRDYVGDYCNLHQRPDLQRLIPRSEKTDFSSYLYKYDRRFRRQGRYFISTNHALYIIDEECVKIGSSGKSNNSTVQKNKQQEGYTIEYKIKRRISLENITEIKLSEYRDNYFLICVNNDYSTLLELSSKTEAISIILKNYLKKTNRVLPITFGQGFDYAVKKQSWIGGGTRSVKFAHAATAALMNQIDPNKLRKGVDMPRDYDVKINRNTMTVMISSGLSKQSRPNQTNAEKPRGLQFKSTTSNTSRKPPVKPPRPAAAKPMKQKKLRALYDFQARSADELSFFADNELILIENSDETWWKAELDGKIGVVPSNYVELIRTPIVIIKPILYGNTAKHFGSKRDSDGHTHKWTLYVRSFNNDDLSTYVSKVQFRLHETYPNHTRMITQAPFEVEESGWGEFETQITIFFADPNEKPVVFYHHLKLFSTDPDVVAGTKALVNEHYDELIFQEPSDLLARLLNCAKSLAPPTDENLATEKEYAAKKFDTITRIKNARQRVRNEIQDLTERLRITQENIKRVRQKSIDNNSSMGTFNISTHDNIKREIVD